jgi:hypothetical protein
MIEHLEVPNGRLTVSPPLIASAIVSKTAFTPQPYARRFPGPLLVHYFSANRSRAASISGRYSAAHVQRVVNGSSSVRPRAVNS